MNDDFDHLWIQRPDAEPPTDFADRVMDAIRQEPPPRPKGVLFLLQTSPTLRTAACILAGLTCLYRMAAVVAVFFVQ